MLSIERIERYLHEKRTKQWGKIDRILILQIIVITYINTLNAATKRYSHGDGAFKFLRAYYEHQQNLPVTIWRNDQVSRDYVNTFTEILARISISLNEGKVSNSFNLFSILIATFSTILFGAFYIFAYRNLPKLIGRVLTLGTTCLFIYASAFPDAEIIFAAPITFWIVISLTRYITGNLESRKIVLPLFFLIFFGYGIHEALILAIAVFTLILLGGMMLKQSIRFKSNWILFVCLSIFSTIGILRLVNSSSKAPTANSIYHAALFDPRNILSQPSIFIVFVITLLSFQVYYGMNSRWFGKDNTSRSDMVKFAVLGMLISFLVTLLEIDRRNSHWSFTANRIDLMWFVIVFSLFLPLFSVFSKKKVFPEICTTKISIVLIGTLLAMTTVRTAESVTWIECKQENAILAKRFSDASERNTLQKKSCDWGWTDPGTYLLINREKTLTHLPSGDENVFPDPVIINPKEVVIFNMRIRINN